MNWKEVVLRIRELGGSNTEIAKRCGMSASWVSAILDGRLKEIGWDAGDKMLKFKDLLERRAQIV